MEKDKTIERLKSCMLMDYACSAVYHLMAMHYPEEKELWNELASVEESHADVIAKALGFKIINYSDFTIPPELKLIRKTVDYANEIREKLLNDKISLKEALEMMKALQELRNESCYHDLIEKEPEERIKKVFRRFYEVDKTNLDLIRAVMLRYGFKTDG